MVYESICLILEANGFVKAPNGDMVGHSTGCKFSVAFLSKYKTVVDFQIEWHYTTS